MVLIAPPGRRPRILRTISRLTEAAYFENQVCLRVYTKTRTQYSVSWMLYDCSYEDVLTCHTDRASA